MRYDGRTMLLASGVSAAMMAIRGNAGRIVETNSTNVNMGYNP
ncbi:MAG: hypothetical protein ABW048_08710 [Sphingobium sp.]